MRRRGLLVPLPAAALLLAAAPAMAAPAMAASAWTVTPSPNPSATGDRLNGAAARAATDAWAVGQFTAPDADADGQQMLAARWDGAQWRQVATPAVSHQDEVLSGVSADAADDAWAVGFTKKVSAAARSPLAVHWNGTAWTSVPVPNTAGGAKSVFTGVAALAPDNAWAVGRGLDARALVEHWNGTSWTVAPTPAPPVPAGWTVAGATLNGVSARSADDIWAVGTVTAIMGVTTQDRTLAMHYDGTSWKITPTPTNGTTTVGNQLNAVTAITPKDVWSVGKVATSNGTTPTQTTVIQHWNGTVWSSVPAPVRGGFTGVAARSATDVWAVGDFSDGSGAAGSILHWNGSAWSKTAAPDGATGSILTGAAATPGGGDVWASGFDLLGPSDYRTVILRNTP
ncbi:hypothetical protein [Actinomadura sp. NTSP31]|uniref:hypothetical protein n=1 Tax=Actinomadura sp. NTSP31 TaxID=1735447 RepID=UPI0035C088DE